MAELEHDLDEARRFLERLGGAGPFGFRTFDDAKKAKQKRGEEPDPRLIVMRHGRFADVADELVRYNERGAGVFVSVNELDGRGYSTANVRRARAVIVDLDHDDPVAARAALDAARDGALPPSGVMETSPDRFHLYWFADDLALEDFGDVCRGLIARFGGDPSVHDLARVMRLPGFFHRKDAETPFRSRIVYLSDARYAGAALVREFAAAATPTAPRPTPGDDDRATTEFDAVSLRDALRAIPAEDRETYITVIRAVKLSATEAGFSLDEARAIVETWARSSRKFDEKEFAERWADFKKAGPRAQRLGTVFKLARDYGWHHTAQLSVDDFYAYMPAHTYLYVHTRDQWPAGSVNARVPAIPMSGGPMPAATWLDRNRPVDQVTWAPGEPPVIEGKFVSDAGWIPHPAARVFNLYRPPVVRDGDPRAAEPWLEHVRRLYPEEAEHLLGWLAHRVQFPGRKINHGVVLGGAPGIGKDSLLAPVKEAVGPWNFAEASPTVILSDWTWFVKSVILRVSEARDLGGSDSNPKNRFSFYEHLKVYAAAPPETLGVNEKNLKQYVVPNVTGVVVTTNHRDGLYLPSDDRRWLVCWSPIAKGETPGAYWRALWAWLEGGGARHVAAYLRTRDLADFDPYAEPPKTAAFWAAAQTGMDPVAAPIADALDALGRPPVVTGREVLDRLDSELREALGAARARRLPHLLAEVGYERVSNPEEKSGRWKIDGRRETVFALAELDRAGALTAARARASRSETEAKLPANCREPEIPF